ncbi:hypothetical protein RyT2_17280 [Pseudolactococcus yaeyamensis]
MTEKNDDKSLLEQALSVKKEVPYEVEEKDGVKTLSTRKPKDKFKPNKAFDKNITSKTSKKSDAFSLAEANRAKKKKIEKVGNFLDKKSTDKKTDKSSISTPSGTKAGQVVKKAGKQALITYGSNKISDEDSETASVINAHKNSVDTVFKGAKKIKRFTTNRNKFSKSITTKKVDNIRFGGMKPSKTIQSATGNTAVKSSVSNGGVVGWIKNFLQFKIAIGGTSFAIGGVAGAISLIIMLVTFSFTLLLSGVDESENSSGFGTAPVTGEPLRVATELNRYLIKTEGAKQEGAAGALANAQRESMFDVKAHNPSGGVAGIFQWSGWSNTINGSRITSEGSIKAGDESTLTLENELKLLGYELNGGYKDVKDYIGKATKPEDAADYWLVHYEGVALDDGQGNVKITRQNAIIWYNYFTGGGGGTAAQGSLEILESQLGKKIGSGQCYALVDQGYAQHFGIKLQGLNAKDIGSDNKAAFEAKGWTVIANPKPSDLKAGAIICWGAGPVSGSASQNPYGHTGVIYNVSDDGQKFSTYEQNANFNQTCQKYGRSYDSSITYVCIPPAG